MFVIAGVTGHTGGAAAGALLDGGKKVRVIVREASKGDAWNARGAEVAVASFENHGALASALQGAEGAYLLLPPFAPNETGLAASRRELRESMISAVRAARPAHVVFLSSLGAQHATGTGPIVYLHAMEQDLASSGIPSTFLRAGFFMENWAPNIPGAVLGGALYHALETRKKIPMIASQDIGRAAAELLLEPIPSGARVVELSGPEPYSLEDTAAALSRLAGRTIRPITVPASAMEQSLLGMGMSNEVAGLYREMVEAINGGKVAEEGGRAQRRRGSTSLETVLKGLLAV